MNGWKMRGTSRTSVWGKGIVFEVFTGMRRWMLMKILSAEKRLPKFGGKARAPLNLKICVRLKQKSF
jgi:hypothetical protein